jgi:hypothetical protein
LLKRFANRATQFQASFGGCGESVQQNAFNDTAPARTGRRLLIVMEKEKALRQHLLDLLKGGHAHATA